MKKLLLFCVVFISFGYLNAQITLERSDYTAQVGNSYEAFSLDTDSSTTPTEGANQVWDYTSLVLMDSYVNTLDPNQDLVNFPDANIEDNFINHQQLGNLIIEEIANNTLKHAEALSIDFHFDVNEDLINIRFADDGKGFALKELEEQTSAGLQSIWSRVKFLDGTIEVESSPGKGTHYTIQIPNTLQVIRYPET